MARKKTICIPISTPAEARQILEKYFNDCVSWGFDVNARAWIGRDMDGTPFLHFERSLQQVKPLPRKQSWAVIPGVKD